MRAFIQVDLDAMNLYPRVAMLAGFGVEHVHRGLNEVWAHCYRTKAGELPAAFLRSFFPESSQVIEALIVCGFVEQLDGDRLRVRGIARRYEKDYNARAEAGRKGGQKTAAKLDRDGGRFTKQTPSKQQKQAAFPPSHQANTAGLVETTSEPSEDPEPGVCVLTKQTKQTTKQTTKPPSKPPSDAWSAWPSHQADPKSKSLSPTERETLSDREPLPRSADATPLEAGREPRKETSEGTRVETAAVPESPAPAPAGLSPKDPVPTERRLMWLPEQLPSPTPPPESEWAAAMTWRLMRMSRLLDGARPRDYAQLAEQQRNAGELYRDVCAELAAKVTEYQGLALLYHLDDRIAEGETDTPARLMRWLRTETRPTEATSDAVH